MSDTYSIAAGSCFRNPLSLGAAMKAKVWWKRNSTEAISEAFQEGTIDAHGDHEQCMSLFYTIEEELEFPFEATHAGDKVSVVGIEQSQHESLGLDLACDKGGNRYLIAARSVELSGELPDGQIFLAAYLDWKSKF